MRDAIKHIEPLASVDEARLTTCFLAPAVRALPNRFEHHGDDAARARDVFGVGAGECARLSTSARSIFMRAASSGASRSRKSSKRAWSSAAAGATVTAAAAVVGAAALGGGAWTSWAKKTLTQPASTSTGGVKLA